MQERPTSRCNDCGYTLDGLAHWDDCPECGRPVARSLPASRAGSAWQRSWRAGETMTDALAKPRTMFEDVRPEHAARSFVLLVLCCVAAGVVMGVSVLVGGPQGGAWRPMEGLLVTLLGSLGLVSLSLTESCGLAFIGWRRGWAHTPAHVLAVVSHASPGWLAGSIVCALAWQVLQRVPAVWTVGGVDVFGMVRVPEGWPVGAVMLLGAGVGLLWFESLSYLGMTRLRYAVR